jgi:hypothetical protein
MNFFTYYLWRLTYNGKGENKTIHCSSEEISKYCTNGWKVISYLQY